MKSAFPIFDKNTAEMKDAPSTSSSKTPKAPRAQSAPAPSHEQLIPGLKEAIHDGNFSVVRKNKQYQTVRERIFDLNRASSRVGSYSPLKDAYLQDFFVLPSVQKHLKTLGLVDEYGNPVTEREFRKRHVMEEKLRRERENDENMARLEINRQIEIAIRQVLEERSAIEKCKQQSKPKEQVSSDPNDLVNRYPQSMRKTVLLYTADKRKRLAKKKAPSIVEESVTSPKSHRRQPAQSDIERPQTAAPFTEGSSGRPTSALPKKTTIVPLSGLSNSSSKDSTTPMNTPSAEKDSDQVEFEELFGQDTSNAPYHEVSTYSSEEFVPEDAGMLDTPRDKLVPEQSTSNFNSDTEIRIELEPALSNFQTPLSPNSKRVCFGSVEKIPTPLAITPMGSYVVLQSSLESVKKDQQPSKGILRNSKDKLTSSSGDVSKSDDVKPRQSNDKLGSGQVKIEVARGFSLDQLKGGSMDPVKQSNSQIVEDIINGY